MKILKMVCFFTVLSFILCTCNDPVFYAISLEVKPIKPRIEGAPTNFVTCTFDSMERMYVASGLNLYSYYNKDGDNSKPYWHEEPAPGGVIFKLASINSNKLYALCTTGRDIDGRTVIKCYDGNSWSKVNGIHDNYIKIQNIFEANNILFIVASVRKTQKEEQYAILYNNGSETKSISDNIGYVNGVVYSSKYSSYYLATSENGVHKVDNPIGSAVKLSGDNKVFTGIINLGSGDETLLIARNRGEIYIIDNTNSYANTGIDMDNMSTGVLAIWTKPGTTNRLLLAGRQDSYTYSVSYGYRYGYMELELGSTGISGSAFWQPGEKSFSTININEYERYQSTLGKQPVNFIFQAPSSIDSNMHLFASTQKNGVWSCRERNSAYEYWNAEGKDEPDKYY